MNSGDITNIKNTGVPWLQEIQECHLITAQGENRYYRIIKHTSGKNEVYSRTDTSSWAYTALWSDDVDHLKDLTRKWLREAFSDHNLEPKWKTGIKWTGWGK